MLYNTAPFIISPLQPFLTFLLPWLPHLPFRPLPLSLSPLTLSPSSLIFRPTAIPITVYPHQHCLISPWPFVSLCLATSSALYLFRSSLCVILLSRLSFISFPLFMVYIWLHWSLLELSLFPTLPVSFT